MNEITVQLDGVKINSPNHAKKWAEYKLYTSSKERNGIGWFIQFELQRALQALQESKQDVSVPTHRQDHIFDSEMHYEVFLTRIAPRRLDEHDNLRAGFKRAADYITQWLYPFSKKGMKDNLITWHYSQESAKPRQYGFKIKIIWK